MLDFWSSRLGSGVQKTIDEFLQAPPQKLYLMASSEFEELIFISQCVIDGNLVKDHYTEDFFIYEIEIPMYAIVAYCDLHTHIDTRCVVELMQAVFWEITNDRIAEGIPTEFGPKRSKAEILSLANQMLVVGVRLGNFLYAKANTAQREGIDEARELEKLKDDAIIEIGSRVIGTDQEGDDEYLTLRECINELSQKFPECKDWDTRRFSMRLNRRRDERGLQPIVRKTGNRSRK